MAPTCWAQDTQPVPPQLRSGWPGLASGDRGQPGHPPAHGDEESGEQVRGENLQQFTAAPTPQQQWRPVLCGKASINVHRWIQGIRSAALPRKQAGIRSEEIAGSSPPRGRDSTVWQHLSQGMVGGIDTTSVSIPAAHPPTQTHLYVECPPITMPPATSQATPGTVSAQ